MALRWRYGNWYIRLWFHGQERLLATGLIKKQEARSVEKAVRSALKSGNFHLLDDLERKICAQVHELSGQEPPTALVPDSVATPAWIEDLEGNDLTLWAAVELMMASPAVNGNGNRERHEQVLAHHIIPYFGPQRLIKTIWVPQIEQYFAFRKAQGAAGSTIAKDKAALSVLFRELKKHRLAEINPVSLIEPISEADGEREVYVSEIHFKAILERCPEWVQPLLRCLYMTGMRANEALILTPAHFDLKGRIIRLQRDETKERRPKRVPIHKDLVLTLESLADGKSPEQRIFSSGRKACVRIDSVRKPWNLAIEKAISDLKIKQELDCVTVKDLRHVTATNMQRSGVSEVLREFILGHALKKKTVELRYLAICDQDLRDAIDMTTFDHGETEIHIARKKKIPAAATVGNNKT